MLLPLPLRLLVVLVVFAVNPASGLASVTEPDDLEREIEALFDLRKYREAADRLKSELQGLQETSETRGRRNLLASWAVNAYLEGFRQAPSDCEFASEGLQLADDYLGGLLSVHGEEARGSDMYTGVFELRQELDRDRMKQGCLQSEGQKTAEPKRGDGSASPPAETDAQPVEATKRRRTDWALRFLPGYSMSPWGGSIEGLAHSAHLGIAVHASRRFGPGQRGYVGGGPRLHVVVPISWPYPILGLEGDVLVGGGSSRVVGLMSIRMGSGVLVDGPRPAMWLVGGPVVLAKITPRWSVGGHVEAGVLGAPYYDSPISAHFAFEAGFNFAWHFGRGRREGI